MERIRIHHFFDIIRDHGKGKLLKPHPYGHAYHTVGNRLISGEIDQIRLVIENDDICCDCSKLVSGHCIDTIHHRADFTSKEKFNDYLDSRIMKTLGLEGGQIISIEALLDLTCIYLDHIEDLYEGNDPEHTRTRAVNVTRGTHLMKAIISGNLSQYTTEENENG